MSTGTSVMTELTEGGTTETSHHKALRLVAYKFLTQLIVLLGRVRDAILEGQRVEVVAHRTCDVLDSDWWFCCDCGAIHYFKSFDMPNSCGHEAINPTKDIIGHIWPMRPIGYNYRWRFGARAATLAQYRRKKL